MAAKPKYIRSGGGEREEERCQAEFRDLLERCAVVFMKKRRSNTLDESDFANAFRDLLSSVHVDWLRTGLGVAIIAMSGYFFADAQDKWALGVGAVFVGEFIQFYPYWKRC